MSDYIEKRESSSDLVLYLSKGTIKKKTYIALRKISSLLLFSPLVFFISPLFGFFTLFYVMAIFYRDIYMPIFMNKKLFEKYYETFSPGVDATSLAIVGYRVEWDEIDEHIAIVSGEDEEITRKKLLAKQKEMMLPKNRDRWVGFGKKTLTTHIALAGTTGSGKTEGIRSIAEASMRNGGGVGMNDGKSDEKMLVEILTQAKEANRETSCFVLNYLKGEKMAESNTLNPIAMMHPIKAVEFLGSLIQDGSSSDGTKEYFFNRGKVLLSGPMNALSLRRQLLGEPYDFDRIMEFRNIKGLVVLELLFYCMCRDLNNMIKESKTLKSRLDSFRSSFSDSNLKFLHTLVDYVTQNPTDKDIVETELKMRYVTIKEIYSNTYLLIKNYLDGIWNNYADYLDAVGQVLYAYIKNEGQVFLTSNKNESIIGFESFKKDYYEVLKNKISKEAGRGSITAIEEIKQVLTKSGVKDSEIILEKFKKALTNKKQQGGNIEDIPEDAVQQHAYASQNWDELSNVFTQYKHIFGQTKSEIDPNRLILDNKILYVLIPVTELSDKYINIIGKMTVMLVKEVAAIALGGEKISVHKTIKNILRDRMSPKPFTLEVLDEYNSYPIPGVDKFLMQFRSLNISIVLGIQNFAGLKAGGDDQTSQENALANTMKWFTKTEDETAIKWAREMIGKNLVLKNELQVDAFNEIIDSSTTKVEESEVFKPERLRDFANGFSLVLAGSKKNKIIPMQSFYRGGKSETVHIKRFNPIEL